MGRLSSLIDAFVGGTAYITEQMYQTLFSISPLQTERVWPLGRPVGGGGSGDPNILLSGELVPYVANQAYDKVAPSQGGEILIFSLTIFIIFYISGGYLQFFDWRMDNPSRKRDPVNGFFLLLLWFPIYYGFLGVVHGVLLMIPIGVTDVSFFITTLTSSAILFSGISKIAIVIGSIPIVIMAMVMVLRGIVIGVYFLFGPVLIAIGWSDIPKASEVAVNLLKKCVPVGLIPLPIYFMLYFYSFIMSGQEVLGYDLGGWGEATAFLAGVGVFVYAVSTWITLWLMWLVFKKSGRYVDHVGRVGGQVGGTLGLVSVGRTDDAQRFVRYGPDSFLTREAAGRASHWGGEQKERAKRASGGVKQTVEDRFDNLWGEGGSRR